MVTLEKYTWKCRLHEEYEYGYAFPLHMSHSSYPEVRIVRHWTVRHRPWPQKVLMCSLSHLLFMYVLKSLYQETNYCIIYTETERYVISVEILYPSFQPPNVLSSFHFLLSFLNVYDCMHNGLTLIFWFAASSSLSCFVWHDLILSSFNIPKVQENHSENQLALWNMRKTYKCMLVLCLCSYSITKLSVVL